MILRKDQLWARAEAEINSRLPQIRFRSSFLRMVARVFAVSPKSVSSEPASPPSVSPNSGSAEHAFNVLGF